MFVIALRTAASRLTKFVKPIVMAGCCMLFALGDSSSALSQSIVNNLGGSLTGIFNDSIGAGKQVTQIAFAPGDLQHAYVSTFGSGILRYDYNPDAVVGANVFTNETVVVPGSVSTLGGVPGSLGIAFHSDPTLGMVMYIAPTVPFIGGNATNQIANQHIVRLTDAGGNGVFGDEPSDLVQSIVNNVSVSHVHQINQLQVRGNRLYAAIGVRTQNGGQTAAQNIAIGGSGVDQSATGESEYTGTVAFIDDLTLLSNDTTTANVAGFNIPAVSGNRTQFNAAQQTAYQAINTDTQAFTSTDPGKLRIFSTGLRNDYGIAVNEQGELWVSMNQNENPNAPDELHRSFFQADHGFFKGNSFVGDWKVDGDDNVSGPDPSAAAIAAGYFALQNSTTPFATLGFNTAAGGLDFFSSTAANAALRGDVLVSRNSGGGQDIVHVDLDTGDTTVVVESLPAALEVRRDPFGNFLAGGSGVVSLLRIDRIIRPDLNLDGTFDVADWNEFKTNYGSSTAGLSGAAAFYAGDLNNDGIVNLFDADRFANEYEAVFGAGSFAALSALVPEPASGALALLAAGLGIAWKRRGR